MKINKNLIVNLLIFILLLSTAVLNYNYFYNMKLKNCQSIVSSDYHVSTEDVSGCYRFYNYPFWEFTFYYYILWGILHIIIFAIQLMAGWWL